MTGQFNDKKDVIGRKLSNKNTKVKYRFGEKRWGTNVNMEINKENRKEWNEFIKLYDFYDTEND